MRARDAQALRGSAAALAGAAASDARLAGARDALRAYLREIDGLERAPEDLRDILWARGLRLASLAACRVPEAADQDAPVSPEDDVRRLRGVGAATAERLAARGVRTVGDLLAFVPRCYEDRRRVAAIADLREGERATVRGRARAVRAWRGRLEVTLDDGGRRLALVWFRRAGMAARIERDAEYLATGVARRWRERLQMAHPDLVRYDATGPSVRARYPEVEGVAPRVVERLCRQACREFLDRVVDGVPRDMAARLGLPGQAEAIRALHAVPDDTPPEAVEALNVGETPAQRRLIFDELFFLQLGLARRRSYDRREAAPRCDPEPAVLERLVAALPFEPTRGQRRVIEELRADLARPEPMNRLLQGDVASGKTVCALAAAELAMAAGHQVALMAPTEILAEQHHSTLAPLLERLGRRHALLTATTPRPVRESILAMTEAGRIHLVCGTHALLAERVVFADLGLAIVDEQHRFGVAQRARLRAKGHAVPHLLVMTATPIPRTMALTLYGDLDLSILDELPPGRRPPATRVLEENERDEAYAALAATAGRDGCAYLVCPLVEESEEMDLRDAVSTCERLRRARPALRVALVHGRTPAHERDPIVARLRRGEVDVLVTTSLIEVGLDVPHATLLVVEHAERFGLAQLHQLRGRVGRGAERGTCLLLTSAEPGSAARRRLDTLAATTDGFRIAEADLELRGPGELFGTRQAGLPRLRFADLGRHADLLAAAREEARRLIEDDPDLARHPETRRVLDDRWAEAALYGEEAG